MIPPRIPPDEVGRALAAINASRLADISGPYSKVIAELGAFQKQLHSLPEPFPLFQAQYAQILSQFDMSRVIMADQVISRLGVQITTLNQQLIYQITLPTAEIAQSILRDFAPSAQMIAQFRAQFEEITKLIDQASWRDLEPLMELAKRAGPAQAVRDAFLAYGLWLAPSMPEDLVQTVIHLHSKGARSSTVNSVVSRYYAKNNWKLLDRVLGACRGNHLLVPRSEPIRQALQAHREGLYAVSIPALLLQIEGIAADYVKANHLMPKIGSQTKEIIVAALEHTPCSLSDVRTYAGVTALLAYIEKMYRFVDFDQNHHSLLREKRLVAHAIRHGRQVAYGSRMNSLRFFLMIDVLALLGHESRHDR